MSVRGSEKCPQCVDWKHKITITRPVLCQYYRHVHRENLNSVSWAYFPVIFLFISLILFKLKLWQVRTTNYYPVARLWKFPFWLYVFCTFIHALSPRSCPSNIPGGHPDVSPCWKDPLWAKGSGSLGGPVQVKPQSPWAVESGKMTLALLMESK